MKNPKLALEKSLIPSLFQIAARANECESAPALKSLMRRPAPADTMLNAEKLEAILKSLAKKKKMRRFSGDQRISIGVRQMA